MIRSKLMKKKKIQFYFVEEIEKKTWWYRWDQTWIRTFDRLTGNIFVSFYWINNKSTIFRNVWKYIRRIKKKRRLNSMSFAHSCWSSYDTIDPRRWRQSTSLSIYHEEQIYIDIDVWLPVFAQKWTQTHLTENVII